MSNYLIPGKLPNGGFLQNAFDTLFVPSNWNKPTDPTILVMFQMKSSVTSCEQNIRNETIQTTNELTVKRFSITELPTRITFD